MNATEKPAIDRLIECCRLQAVPATDAGRLRNEKTLVLCASSQRASSTSAISPSGFPPHHGAGDAGLAPIFWNDENEQAESQEVSPMIQA